MVLRLHNLCWRHAVQCRRVLTPTKVLTYRKLFGLYFHSIVSHAAFLLRIVSHRSTNAEMCERLFEKLSDITTKTWSKRIEDLCSNAILHYQAEKGSERVTVKEEREISKLAKNLPRLGNTILSKEFLHKYADDWGAHMKLIADFLQPGQDVWWSEIEGDSIEFFDGPNEPEFRDEGPRLHHFRSTSIKEEQHYLDDCWNNCLTEEVKLPATRIRNLSGQWHVPPACCNLQAPVDPQHQGMNNTVDHNRLSDDDFQECRDSSADHECSDHEMDEGECTTFLEEEIHADDAVADDQEVTTETSREEPEADSMPDLHQSVEVTTGEHPQPPAKKPCMEHDRECAIDDRECTTKTTQALQQVLGKCLEVTKYDKLKSCLVQWNPALRPPH